MVVDQKADKLIRRTTMIASVTAAYFLLTADYGPDLNALTPIKKSIESAQSSLKRFIFGQGKDSEDVHEESPQLKNPQQHDSVKTN